MIPDRDRRGGGEAPSTPPTGGGAVAPPRSALTPPRRGPTRPPAPRASPPAGGHDDDGNPAPVERDRALGLPAVKEMKLACDFEGQVEWVLGVAGASPYRVSELTGPTRVVVDIRHRP